MIISFRFKNRLTERWGAEVPCAVKRSAVRGEMALARLYCWRCQQGCLVQFGAAERGLGLRLHTSA